MNRGCWSGGRSLVMCLLSLLLSQCSAYGQVTHIEVQLRWVDAESPPLFDPINDQGDYIAVWRHGDYQKMTTVGSTTFFGAELVDARIAQSGFDFGGRAHFMVFIDWQPAELYVQEPFNSALSGAPSSSADAAYVLFGHGWATSQQNGSPSNEPSTVWTWAEQSGGPATPFSCVLGHVDYDCSQCDQDGDDIVDCCDPDLAGPQPTPGGIGGGPPIYDPRYCDSDGDGRANICDPDSRWYEPSNCDDDDDGCCDSCDSDSPGYRGSPCPNCQPVGVGISLQPCYDNDGNEIDCGWHNNYGSMDGNPCNYTVPDPDPPPGGGGGGSPGPIPGPWPDPTPLPPQPPPIPDPPIGGPIPPAPVPPRPEPPAPPIPPDDECCQALLFYLQDIDAGVWNMYNWVQYFGWVQFPSMIDATNDVKQSVDSIFANVEEYFPSFVSGLEWVGQRVEIQTGVQQLHYQEQQGHAAALETALYADAPFNNTTWFSIMDELLGNGLFAVYNEQSWLEVIHEDDLIPFRGAFDAYVTADAQSSFDRNELLGVLVGIGQQQTTLQTAMQADVAAIRVALAPPVGDPEALEFNEPPEVPLYDTGDPENPTPVIEATKRIGYSADSLLNEYVGWGTHPSDPSDPQSPPVVRKGFELPDLPGWEEGQRGSDPPVWEFELPLAEWFGGVWGTPGINELTLVVDWVFWEDFRLYAHLGIMFSISIWSLGTMWEELRRYG